jgi:hydroxymethylpyrimidine pyrophosphatase-like HAD family hydrolase
MATRRKISLVLSDVDGTLVTEEKLLTERAQAAVLALHEAGIRFAITSGRPPLGMAMLFDPLRLDTPIAAFNGGLFVDRNLSVVGQKTLPADVAGSAIDLIRARGSMPGSIGGTTGSSPRSTPRMLPGRPGRSSSSRKR